MPAAIWATPMARVRLGRRERPRMRSRQGLGPRFQALASATGWMRAMTPSPIRTMAAKCFARVGVVMSIVVRGWMGGGVLSAGAVAKCGASGGRRRTGNDFDAKGAKGAKFRDVERTTARSEADSRRE